ncbi:hypothetical protein LSH36_321g06004 [Paralvinella palmiformis]|uniref:Uncharacterized protein n=1 Tax=Paralvinella palmiformis TaxID=53620 RepID=A0AAD9JGU1_9ANNE|nr:hypothetical protein LSH36_321g06004 [Paralvinella palmiformis]
MSSSDVETDCPTTLGYDAAFSPDLDEKYKCPVCLVALRDPLQTVCGHRFCRVCLTRSRGRSLFGKCPLDKTLFDPSQVFEDNAVRREVLSLTIKCDHHKDGCTWRGELRDRESHASRCAEAKVNCSNDCGHVCSKRLMPTHIVLCPLRMESCEKCGLTLLASELAKHHLLVCEQFPLPCTVCGQVELTRPNMVRHVDVIEGDCPMVIVKCQFEKLGCYFQVSGIGGTNWTKPRQ